MERQKNFADTDNNGHAKRRHETSEPEIHEGRENRKHRFGRNPKHRDKKFHGRQHSNARSETHNKRYPNNDQCPIHLNSKHTWGMCFLNPNGENYRKGPSSNGSNSSNHNGGSNGNEARANNKHGAKKSTHRNSNYQGPTHQTYFQSDDDDYSSDSTNFSSYASDSTPQHENKPGVAGRTQTVGRAHGRNNDDSRGASLTGYETS